MAEHLFVVIPETYDFKEYLTNLSNKVDITEVIEILHRLSHSKENIQIHCQEYNTPDDDNWEEIWSYQIVVNILKEANLVAHNHYEDQQADDRIINIAPKLKSMTSLLVLKG